jgi:hypothetical protein
MRLKHTILCSGFAFAVVLAIVPAALTGFTKGRVVAPFISEFKPGDYVHRQNLQGDNRHEAIQPERG